MYFQFHNFIKSRLFRLWMINTVSWSRWTIWYLTCIEIRITIILFSFYRFFYFQSHYLIISTLIIIYWWIFIHTFVSICIYRFCAWKWLYTLLRWFYTTGWFVKWWIFGCLFGFLFFMWWQTKTYVLWIWAHWCFLGWVYHWVVRLDWALF